MKNPFKDINAPQVFLSLRMVQSIVKWFKNEQRDYLEGEPREGDLVMAWTRPAGGPEVVSIGRLLEIEEVSGGFSPSQPVKVYHVDGQNELAPPVTYRHDHCIRIRRGAKRRLLKKYK